MARFAVVAQESPRSEDVQGRRPAVEWWLKMIERYIAGTSTLIASIMRPGAALWMIVQRNVRWLLDVSLRTPERA